MLYEELSGNVIGAFFDVYNGLGEGYLERVYHRAMKVELQLRGLPFESEKLITVCYRGEPVGDYRADLICDGKILIEIKVGPALHPSVFRQTMNYLRATGIRLGLILHFGPTPEFKRVLGRPDSCVCPGHGKSPIRPCPTSPRSGDSRDS